MSESQLSPAPMLDTFTYNDKVVRNFVALRDLGHSWPPCGRVYCPAACGDGRNLGATLVKCDMAGFGVVSTAYECGYFIFERYLCRCVLRHSASVEDPSIWWLAADLHFGCGNL